MPAFTRSLTRRHRPAGRPLHAEALERREMLFAPGGNVTAQLVGSTLLLTGDALGNQLMVASVTGGKVAVLGVNVGTTINGSTNPFVTSRPVVSIIADLDGGDDLIGFGNSAQHFDDQLDELQVPVSPFVVATLQDAIDAVSDGATTFTLPGSLTLTTADGGDQVGILGAIDGSLVVDLGSAPVGPGIGNGLFIGGLPYSSRVDGGVSIVGGAQADVAAISATSVSGGVTAALGGVQIGGTNTLYIYQSSIASLAYTGGSGADNVSADESRIRFGVSVVTGGSLDYVELNGTPATTVGGSVAIDTGAYDDFVTLSAVVSGAVSVVTGTGDDKVEFSGLSVGRNAVVDTGVGDDGVEIIDSRVRHNLFVALGAGKDLLLMTGAVSILAAYLDGGPGTNSLFIADATRPGIRRLYSVRFQSGVG